MSRSLSRTQAAVLGGVVVACLVVGAWALLRIGNRSGFFDDTCELVVYVPDAGDVEKGTPVKVRGVEAGKVVAVEYPEEDGDEGMIRLRLRLDKKFEERLFADASAAVVSKGLLGTSFVTIHPGKPSAGPLASKVIRARQQPDLAEVTARLASVATRMDNVLREVEQGNGTAGKLLKDESLYTDLKQTAAEARRLLQNTDESVTALREDARDTMTAAQKAIEGVNESLGVVRKEVAGVKDVVRTSKDAVTSIKQNADAIKAMPIVRNYVTDEVKVLVRPNCMKDRVIYTAEDLFEPGKAVLTGEGRDRLGKVAAWLRGQKQKGSDVVVASFADPMNKDETAASARELTRKQSEVVAQYLKDNGVAKMGTFSSRKITPLGLGFEPTPVVEKEEMFPARTEIILFVPQ
jgi:phospholipid/cholesterol/gamma-HCH transport system substrate-binding protein